MVDVKVHFQMTDVPRRLWGRQLEKEVGLEALGGQPCQGEGFVPNPNQTASPRGPHFSW